MDRVLSLTDPILITLETNLDQARELAAGEEVSSFLVKQLSSSTWAYILGDHICLITRAFTAMARVDCTRYAGGILTLERVSRTNLQDVTSAFRDGYKISAYWVYENEGELASPSLGATSLWSMLEGEDQQSTIINEAKTPPVTRKADPNQPPKSAVTAVQDGPILPQTEIDKLVLALRNSLLQAGMPLIQPNNFSEAIVVTPSNRTSPIEESGTNIQVSSSIETSSPPIRHTDTSNYPVLTSNLRSELSDMIITNDDNPTINPPTLFQLCNGDLFENHNLSEEIPHSGVEDKSFIESWPPPPEMIDPGLVIESDISSQSKPDTTKVEPLSQSIDLDYSYKKESLPEDNVAAPVPNEFNQPSQTQKETQIKSSLIDFLQGQQYSVVIFDNLDSIERFFEIAVKDMDSVLSMWQGNIINLHLSTQIRQVIDDLLSKYRLSATNIEAEITKIRVLEQLLPNLQNYHEQEGKLSKELNMIAIEMQNIRLKHVMDTHEGHLIARRVFNIAFERERLYFRLQQTSYRLLKSLATTYFTRCRYRLNRSKYLAAQREIESCFDKIIIMERDVQRRLEYQADWQMLIKKRTMIERELEEIGRFIRVTATLPKGVPTDPEALRRWVKSEWELIRRKEKLLRAWQDCLTDEKAWSVRSKDESMTVLGDASLLAIPGIVRGAFLVVVAQDPNHIMPNAPDECASWAILDTNQKMVSSGRGIGQISNPIMAVISELARDAGVDIEDTLSLLGFEKQAG